MRNKYKNIITHVDGYRFDSKKESERYCELKLLVKAGQITKLQLQPKFEIQEAFTKNSKGYGAIKYIADFTYQENGKTVIEDVKGVKTAVYRIKKKMFEKRYKDLTITEI